LNDEQPVIPESNSLWLICLFQVMGEALPSEGFLADWAL
jgi:hypothetical protein